MLIEVICICLMNWEAASAVANIVLTIVTVAALIFSIYQNWQMRKQKFEDERARLSISIVERDRHYQLRITNVGLCTAYNIKLLFNHDFLDILKKNYLIEWENIQAKAFNLERGNSLYLDILPVIRFQELRFLENKDVTSLKSMGHHNLAWLKENGNKLITISGTYNESYKIKEEFSLLDYIILGVDKDENPVVDALNNIGNSIGAGKFATLNDHLKTISDYYKHENAIRRVYGNRMRITSQYPDQKIREDSLWTILKEYLKKRFKL